MTINKTELKALADRVMTDRRFCVDECHRELAVGVLALLGEIESLQQFKTAYMEWSDKTEWVQGIATAKDLGKHRADVLREHFNRIKAENEALAHLLKRFVDGEHDDAEDQNDRHHYHGEAEALLARIDGEFREYSLVPYEALLAQRTELEALRRDAERYRWLRDGAGYCDTRDIPGMAPARMDAFIDAARYKERDHD